jgi:hypothetical protein
MDFVIPAGSATNLPKEMVDAIVKEAVEKSIVLKLIDKRSQLIEVANEKTLPVLGAADVSKVYRLDTTSDITTLTENDFSIKTPDLEPIEMGTYIRLKRKQAEQYPALQLDNLFKGMISEAIARSGDRIAIIGDTGAVGATNALSIADGIATLAENDCANSPVEYSTSNAQAVLDAVAEGLNDMGLYGDEEYLPDLVLFASPDFKTACQKSADKDVIGYEIADYAPLGLRNVIFLHGVPVIKRSNITGEKAVLTNLRGAYAGYYGNLEVDVQHEAGRRGDLLVITYWFDFEWALKNNSSDAEGMIVIQKNS